MNTKQQELLQATGLTIAGAIAGKLLEKGVNFALAKFAPKIATHKFGRFIPAVATTAIGTAGVVLLDDKMAKNVSTGVAVGGAVSIAGKAVPRLGSVPCGCQNKERNPDLSYQVDVFNRNTPSNCSHSLGNVVYEYNPSLPPPMVESAEIVESDEMVEPTEMVESEKTLTPAEEVDFEEDHLQDFSITQHLLLEN